MQYLVMPFTRCMMLCGYKSKKYQAHWGYPHYGVDISTYQGNTGNDHRILASGEGVVLAAGKDSRLRYGAAVLYKDVFNRQTGKTVNVVGRYVHMKSVSVKTGDKVKAGRSRSFPTAIPLVSVTLLMTPFLMPLSLLSPLRWMPLPAPLFPARPSWLPWRTPFPRSANNIPHKLICTAKEGACSFAGSLFICEIMGLVSGIV